MSKPIDVRDCDGTKCAEIDERGVLRQISEDDDDSMFDIWKDSGLRDRTPPFCVRHAIVRGIDGARVEVFGVNSIRSGGDIIRRITYRGQIWWDVWRRAGTDQSRAYVMETGGAA